MKRADKRVEFIANACVIAAALMFIFTLGWSVLRARQANRAHPSAITDGSRIALTRDWSDSQQTLVLVLSTECKYCTASAPFYRRLLAQTSVNRHTKLLALFPQSSTESKKYMDALDVKFDHVEQVAPASVGAKGTPTLILVNASGVVIRTWEGLLPPDKQTEVLASVN